MTNTSFIQPIIQAVAEHTNVKPIEILSNSREGRIVRARHIAMWIACYYTKASLQSIAAALNCKRHATVIHGREQMDNICYFDKNFSNELHELAKLIK